MKPEDVPADLIRIATEGLMGCEVRGILANVIPEIERRERERVAANADSLAVQFAALRSASTEAEAATLRWFAAWLRAVRRDAPKPPATGSAQGRPS